MPSNENGRLPPRSAGDREAEQTRAAYRGHPQLDPRFPSRAPSQVRHWVGTFRRLLADDDPALDHFVLPLGPCGATADLAGTVNACLRDVDVYLDDVLGILPDELRDRLNPLPVTRELNDPFQLLKASFRAGTPRARYEAQRKLYLGRLLFAIDHWRTVQDGQRHKTLLEQHIERTLLAGSLDNPEREVCCRYESDDPSNGHLQMTIREDEQAQCWRFRPRTVPAGNGWPAIEIFHHRYRFKREAIPGAPAITPKGFLHLGEMTRVPALGRRSGSILSKMICRGITDPRQVQDVLGAMFIVADRHQAYVLEQRLLAVLGGPAWVRDRTDTLCGERERGLLSRRSAAGFEVLKETVDVLVDDPASGLYQFGVELQIYPLSSYLGTLHDAHYASHTAYKRRQFVQDILPVLFPVAIFD